jgi:hypothetical protein
MLRTKKYVGKDNLFIMEFIDGGPTKCKSILNQLPKEGKVGYYL